ncbi:MAG: hypothetical protein NUW01_04035 [Gemmatimonadaceae bacterium]|nr:hypothetical protein [Gemmatimonadaceae bacterium]
MNRAGFLKRVLFGVVAAPAVVKTLGEVVEKVGPHARGKMAIHSIPEKPWPRWTPHPRWDSFYLHEGDGVKPHGTITSIDKRTRTITLDWGD